MLYYFFVLLFIFFFFIIIYDWLSKYDRLNFRLCLNRILLLLFLWFLKIVKNCIWLCLRSGSCILASKIQSSLILGRQGLWISKCRRYTCTLLLLLSRVRLGSCRLCIIIKETIHYKFYFFIMLLFFNF